jgi:DNA-binding Xre family transcriptional regulator
MNPIQRLRTDLESRFPKLSIRIDESVQAGGVWNMDVTRGDDYDISVEWRDGEGFGFSTPKDDDLWSAQDEWSSDYSEALARITHLISNGGETTTPPLVRLAELRQARGFSQAELAKRAGLAQPNLSRAENSDEMRLATLKGIVAAMGGKLAIVARFADGSDWELLI